MTKILAGCITRQYDMRRIWDCVNWRRITRYNGAR